MRVTAHNGHHIILKGASGELKKASKAYQKAGLLIPDERPVRSLTPEESCDLPELAEARCRHGAMIFCARCDAGECCGRVGPKSADGSTISEAIMNRIIRNAYDVLIDGQVSMRERRGLKSAEELAPDADVRAAFVNWKACLERRILINALPSMCHARTQTVLPLSAGGRGAG